MTTRVLVVEDHPVVVDGLRTAFAGRTDVEIAGEARSVAEGRSLLRSVACDVVLLDLRLPDGSGIELLRESHDRPDGPAFLILSSFTSPEYVSTAVAMGASGFLLKTAPVGEILAALATIAEGGLAYTPEQFRVSRNAAWAPLTGREHEILRGITRGRTNDEISADLGLAKKTVESYITRLLARFNVLSRTELALHAERMQLLDLPVQESRGNPTR